MSELRPELQEYLAGVPETALEDTPVEEMRAYQERTTRIVAGEGEHVPRVLDLPVEAGHGAIPVRVYHPGDDGEVLPAVLYMHGGGWAVGSLESVDPLCRALANAVPCAVVSVAYRLAPEDPFPAAVDDSEAALRWLLAEGGNLDIDTSRIAVSGDSAGGNLAAVIARRLRDSGGPALAAQALLYPVCDAGMDTDSYERLGEGNGLTHNAMDWYLRQYVDDGIDPAHPDISPLRADDLSGLPPAWIVLASHDVLRDEGQAYADALRAAGVEAEVECVEGTIHGFARMLALTPAAREGLDWLAAGLRRALAP